MKRLTISGEACLETLSLLISMAWADGQLEPAERAGIEAAAEVLNLTKELRSRLGELLVRPIAVDELLVEGLSPRDRAFAYVAAAWLSGIDEDVHEKERALLERAAALFGLAADRRAELEQIARDLEPLRGEGASWAAQIVTLFRAIPQRLEGTDAIEVSFG